MSARRPSLPPDRFVRPTRILAACTSLTLRNTAATIGLAICIACTSGAEQIKPGMSKADVVRILGPASRTTSDRADMDMFLRANSECRSQAIKALIYDRWLIDDVIVAVGQEGHVKCVVRTTIIDKVTE
jgi:hypothetical protein